MLNICIMSFATITCSGPFCNVSFFSILASYLAILALQPLFPIWGTPCASDERFNLLCLLPS